MPAAPLATTTAFVYVGGVLAAWAVVLSVIGFSRREFPGKDATGQRVVIGFSVLLVAASIATAIGTAEEGPHPQSATAAQPSAAPPSSTATSQPSAAGAAQQLALSADATALRFNTNTLSAKAGAVKITLTNPAPLSHNVSLQGPGGVDLHGATVPKGGTSTVTATLKPGTYTFYCSVPGHRQAGMQGTLTVR